MFRAFLNRHIFSRLKRSGLRVERRLLLDVFDAEFYLQKNPDVVDSGMNPLDHFLKYGWREGRDPNPNFDTRYYLAENPDVSDAQINPFAHFILHGRREGRLGMPPDRYQNAHDYAKKGLGLSDEEFSRVEGYFDAAYYVEYNIDVAQNGIDPLLHFLVWGWQEGRDPSPEFTTAFYLEQNQDIAASPRNPFVHWVLHGRAEGRPGSDTLRRVASKEILADPAKINWSACPPEDVKDISEHFDDAFYLECYPDVTALGMDPKVHYLMLGWRLGYDPRPGFSTAYYCDRYIDIQQAGVNPFLHYCRSGHIENRETQSYIEKRQQDFRPMVSVIVPNFNHAKYLPQRLRSIADQTYDNIELIILDDKSTDNSREVIREVVAALDLDARLEFNEANSGNVFQQWRKGLSLASGELIWICESDDFCEPDFLQNLVGAFTDESVNIAFGRIQLSDGQGDRMEGLDEYRENAEPGIWDETITRPAAKWFQGGFGVNNVIANVGGCVFRRIDLPEEVWDEARSYKICGDWFLYVHIAGTGQITFEPSAVAYFRQHGSNTSASNFHQKYYYEENFRILQLLAQTWGTSKRTRLRFIENVEAQYQDFGMAETLGNFNDVFGIPRLLEMTRTRQHIQLYFLGFYPGGGELFPINLANALLEAGFQVSMVAVDLANINQDMQSRLDRRIPVYHAIHLTSKGREDFLNATGVTFLNSHVATADMFLCSLNPDPIERPYVVTLHGSYVAFNDAPRRLTDWVVENVDNWIYTADRNLEFFEKEDVDWDDFVKLPNAMPLDTRESTFSRADLGISENDTVFTFVARGIKRKGWRAAIEAIRILRKKYGRTDAKLIMIGDGIEADHAKALAADLEGVHFVGYQSEINGIFRLSDVLILPTRFEGESYPLCLIQAIQEHLPSIATDLGEIKPMLTDDDGQIAGILLKNQRDSNKYFAELAQSMDQMCERDVRGAFSKVAAKKASVYEMDTLVASYSEVYQTAVKKHGN